jgi:hypothetical protein
MPTAIKCAESYNCPCGAWRWVETARERGELRCSKCNRPFRAEQIGMRRLGKPGPPAPKAKPKAAPAVAKAKAKPKAQARRGGGGAGAPAREWVDIVRGGGTPSPTVRPSAPGSGDRADILRETLALYARHGYGDERVEVQSTKAELAELLRERQARLPPAERVAALHNKLQGLRKECAQGESARDATAKELERLQAKHQKEERLVKELQSEMEETAAELEVAQRALPASQRPLPVGVRRYPGAQEVEEDLDMALGRPEEFFLTQYQNILDDSAVQIVRSITAEYANKMHEMVSRLQTNEAERRWKERKRATEAETDAMGDVGDDAGDWQTARRRGRTGTPSATVDGGPVGPARAASAGTSANPPLGSTGSLIGGGAAELQAAGQAAAAAAAGRGEVSTSGGDGST